MKYTCLVLLLLALPIHAEIYRWQDESGRIIYSDQFHPDAELINVPKPASYKPPVINNVPDAPRADLVQGYELSISSPQEDEALWANDGNVPVSVDLEPALNSEKEEKLVIILDGMPVGEPQSSTSFTVPIIERGSHTIAVSLVDKAGMTLATSAPVTFQYHRPSVR